MYLSRLYIENYKSIQSLDLRFSEGKNIIVGRNNAGKSNVVSAINLVLGEANPTYAKSDNISESSFFAHKVEQNGKTVLQVADEIFIWCEATRRLDEDLDYETLYQCPGFYIHSRFSGKDKEGNRIFRPILFPRKSHPSEYKSIFDTKDDGAQKEYINPKQPGDVPLERQFDDKLEFAWAFRARRNEDGEIEKEMRLLYRQDANSDWVHSFRATIRNELLQSAIIPSFRDPQTQLRLSSWSWYGKLMRYLTSQHSAKSELQAAFDTVREIADSAFLEVRSKVKDSALNISFPGTEIYFQFHSDVGDDLYKNCSIHIDDGYKSPLTEKGSGIQSATIIGLFNYYTKQVNTKSSALLCVEEPELYLHPHARRVISDRLDDFLDNGRNQVILTTHSTDFIRTTSSELRITLVRKIGGSTTASSVSIPKYRKILLDSNQSEVFFADKVVVCEGYDASVLREIAREHYPGEMDKQNVSVIPVNGKDAISAMVKMILSLGIKTYVLADFDYLLRDKDLLAEKYSSKKHESVENLPLSFFEQDHMYPGQGNKAVSRLKVLRNSVRANNEQAFYQAKSLDEIDDDEIRKAVSKLREKGLCLLDGDIETYCKDPTLLTTTNKLSLDKVFELSRRIEDGEKMSELFEVSHFLTLLDCVLERGEQQNTVTS